MWGTTLEPLDEISHPSQAGERPRRRAAERPAKSLAIDPGGVQAGPERPEYVLFGMIAHVQGLPGRAAGQRTGGMVTLTFPNRSQIIINLQKPLHEVWMAAKSGGYHYRFDGLAWQDTKGAGEFFDRLSRDAEQQSGTPLRFVA